MVYLNGSHSPLNVIIRQTVYVSCSIKAGAVGFALYRCPFSCSSSSCSCPEILSFQIVKDYSLKFEEHKLLPYVACHA